jgi:2-oxoglutarate dehydrogenase E1 component
MYDAWRQNPTSVHVSWASYFANLDGGVDPRAAVSVPPSLGGAASTPIAGASAAAGGAPSSDSLAVSYLIRSYQVRGHEMAKLDPLGMNAFRSTEPPAELDYKFHGFSDADLDRKLDLRDSSTGGNTGFLATLGSNRHYTLREVVNKLQTTYCSGLGVEYMHMGDVVKCNWIRDQIETPKWMQYSKAKKLHVFERLAYADCFEEFLQKKFNTTKRFGVEGGDSVIPGLKCMIDRGSELGIQSFVFGMPHRGRLNVLAQVMRKPMPLIFREFMGTHFNDDEVSKMSGDVKYHLGTSMDRTYPDGRSVHLSLVANPSHLEAVNPVVQGKVRAKQFFSGNTEAQFSQHMPIVMHGDAAFAGQGIVYEHMQMAKVPNFAVGGTVHVIVNNQVGFTTDPSNSRSTMYASDLGKAFNIPIFHCNGDDPMSVCAAFETAVEWRQKFHEDIIIDLICYRRSGHNELDQPMYTQPMMYKNIQKHPRPLAVFENYLLGKGACQAEELKKIKDDVMNVLEAEYAAAGDWEMKASDWLSTRWKNFNRSKMSRIRETGVATDILRMIGEKTHTIPADFEVHKQLVKILKERANSISTGAKIDWGTAEMMAFGSLMMEGNHVRLTGQDVQRGTFSHRHAVLTNQKDGSKYTPLNHLPVPPPASPDNKPEFTVQNSILSEFGVLGFEMGYSLENPNTLCLWEAQFGDFVNGAQVMIDQFISAGEDKWMRQSALTMLLPHGYMGQGAEHSSCRIERFLQQVAEDPDVIPTSATDASERMQIQDCNLQVVNCSTPANYFHVLRRQIHRDFRKPLIIATPKSLLREKRCTSTIEEMATGTRFHRVFGDENSAVAADTGKVRKVVLTTGKFYFDLDAERLERNANDIAIIRIEQLAPFPFDKVAEEIAKYPNAKEVIWAQEEPKNMGAWTFVQPRIETATKCLLGKGWRPVYQGRDPAAATATGFGNKVHDLQQKAIMGRVYA